MALSKEAKKKKLEYIKGYTKETYRKFMFYVSMVKEQEIIDHLLQQESISGYIKELIKKDMKENKKD